MQCVDAENQAKSRCNEDSINFRPSPNLRHMKKYFKSKFEEAMANPRSSQGTFDSSPFGHDEREKVNNTTNNAPVVQPPLPPNPPPPDSPTIINLKQEIEDDEYQCNIPKSQPDFDTSDEMIRNTIKTDHSETSEKRDTVKADHSETSDKPEVTMCRNFVRGTCKKGAACIFAHELILSQLTGVYTFCRNFQNSVCTFPKCKFVHATVFEKEYFFRTGYLPPHTLAHLKEATVLQPPPPPPPEETSTEIPQVYANGLPPAAPAQQCITPVAVLNCATVPTVERKEPNVFGAEPSPSTSPKRGWSETNEFSSSPRDLDSCESLPKKCKNCENIEFRLQFNKSMTEKTLRTNEEINKKITSLNKRNATLNVILSTLLRSPNLLTNNVNFTALLAKMLLNNAEAVVPPDA